MNCSENSKKQKVIQHILNICDAIIPKEFNKKNKIN